MTSAQFSHDTSVKNLIKRYPEEALEFLAEDVIVAHGQPVGVVFLDVAVAKDDTAEPGPGQAMDLAIEYTFADGHGVLLVLVEHWSDASRLDLLRTARYYLDLCRRFPKHDILPIALVDDDKPREIKDVVERGALGEVFFHFRSRILQVPALELEKYRQTRNRVALSFTPNMHGNDDVVEQIIRIAQEFCRQHDDAGYKTFFAFWVIEGKLNVEDQRKLDQRLKELDMPEIIDWWIQEGVQKGVEQGIEQGIRAAKLEDARRMLANGASWEFITNVTHLTESDLKES